MVFGGLHGSSGGLLKAARGPTHSPRLFPYIFLDDFLKLCYITFEIYLFAMSGWSMRGLSRPPGVRTLNEGPLSNSHIAIEINIC